MSFNRCTGVKKEINVLWIEKGIVNEKFIVVENMLSGGYYNKDKEGNKMLNQKATV